MARNEEKHLTRLNRLHLQKLREVELEKNPPRPALKLLDTAAEIQRWLPSIKRDLQVALAQTQVPCYSDDKVQEYRMEVDRLQRQYMTFVRKLKQLKPDCDVIPWTSRGYSKRKSDDTDAMTAHSSVTATKRIRLPVMELPGNQVIIPPPPVPQPANQNRPLEFTSFGPRKMDLKTFRERHEEKSAMLDTAADGDNPGSCCEHSTACSRDAARRNSDNNGGYQPQLCGQKPGQRTEQTTSEPRRVGRRFELVADYGSSDDGD